MEADLLMVDSLEEYEKEGRFNYYDAYHIDRIKSVINIDEFTKIVNRRVMELKQQREQNIGKWEGIPKEIQEECEIIKDAEELAQRIQGINPMIKVKVKR